MAIVPREANGVLAHRLDLRRPCGGLEHGQLAGDRLYVIARLAAIFLSFFLAERARTGIAQEWKAIDAAVAVFPLDVHAGTGGDIDFDGFRICNGVHDDSLASLRA